MFHLFEVFNCRSPRYPITRLVSNTLVFLQVDELWVYTKSEMEGVIMDPCKGDSGGPLIIDNGGQPLLVGVLRVILSVLQ